MNQTEQAKRIEKLERQAMLLKAATDNNAVAIKQLETAILDFHDRIGKLEAALRPWLIALNYDTAATPPMNEMVVNPAPE